MGVNEFCVKHYGVLIESKDICYAGRFITTKLYEYDGNLFVELWCDGIRLSFQELFE